MSMNFSEFKELLGADPMNVDPETLRARASGPEFEQAATEAEAFEQKLKSAVDISVDTESLVSDILAVRETPSRRSPVWMAMAASVVMVTGVVAYLWDGIVQPDTVEEYVVQHFNHDGEKLLAKAGGPVNTEKVSAMMARWDLQAAPELMNRVTFIKKCITINGTGAHMIVQTDNGPVNLLVMPNTQVTDRALVSFDNMQAHLIALGGGSAAIIGRDDQSVSAIDALIRGSISSTTPS
jgi:hypothetical protein